MKLARLKSFFAVFIILSLAGCATTSETVDGETVHKRYYKDGILKSVWVTKDNKLNGIKREYTKEGTLKTAVSYKDNVIDGMKNTYYSNGALWKKEIYTNGKLSILQEFNEDGYVINEEVFNNQQENH